MVAMLFKNKVVSIKKSTLYVTNVPNFCRFEKSKISLLALADVKNVKLLGTQVQFLSHLLMLAEKFHFFSKWPKLATRGQSWTHYQYIYKNNTVLRFFSANVPGWDKNRLDKISLWFFYIGSVTANLKSNCLFFFCSAR